MLYYVGMKILGRIAAVVATVVLAVSFVGAGFLVCTTPPVTQALANMFSDDATSPFSRSQLVQVADATRDYSFGSHDKVALYRVIYRVDAQYQKQVEDAGGAVPAGFPQLYVVAEGADGPGADSVNATQYSAVFNGASEMYCFSPETISHLDDCYNLARIAYPVIIVAAIAGVALLIFIGVTGRKRAVGRVLLAAGVLVLVVFAGLGVWAAIDFTGFFTMFHNLFFSQGNWTFPFDSLLICALPTPFWAGMGVVWLVVTLLACVVSILVGRRLIKR